MKRIGTALVALGFALALPAQAESDSDRIRQELRKFFPLATKPAPEAGFRFDGYKLTGATAEMATWSVDLTAGQAIAVNAYTVRSAFLSKAGTVMFTGEDIALPASPGGKATPLTRSFRLRPGIATLRLEVFDRAGNQVVHSESYALEAEALALLEGTAMTRTTSAPVAPAPKTVLPQDGALKYALHLALDTATIEIRNDSSIPLRIEEAVVHYRFPGLDSHDQPNCAKTTLQPGQSTSCAPRDGRTHCSSLMAIDVELKLNGQRFQERLSFDPMLREIPTRPRVELSKPMNKGYGQVEVSFTGQYVRPGTDVIVKALASVDSHRFPIVFRATQRETHIWGMEFPVGPTVNTKVDKFCFQLLEVTSDDSMLCGGVGHLLYREWNQGMIPTESHSGNLFLHNMLCK